MDEAIVDSSVAIKWVFSEDLSKQALGVRTQYRLLAPELIVAEWTNILWKKVKRGEFTKEEADVASAALKLAGVELTSTSRLARGALRLSIDLDHPAYDCFYLELSRIREIPLITADERLVRKVAAMSTLSFPKPLTLKNAV